MAIPNPQPQLDVPLDVAMGLAKGVFTQRGSIVRWAAGAAGGRGGQIYKHLPEVRYEKPVEAVAKSAANLNPKIYVPLAVAGGVGLTFLGWVAKQRGAQKQYVTSVVLAFETSLRAYIATAQAGDLDSAVVERLASDLDGLQALSAAGKRIQVSLDDLVPLFELVIAHTTKLAEAYNVELDDLDKVDAEGGVVVSLRRHLEAQRRILYEAA